MQNNGSVFKLSSLLLGVSLFWGCPGKNPVISGTVTETGNAKILGKVVDQSGREKAGVDMYLIHQNYNPVATGSIPDSLRDTTDVQGHYSFSINDSGLFNVQGNHPTEGTILLIKGIQVRPKDTLEVKTDTLRDAGLVQLGISDALAGTTLFFYIPGSVYADSLDLKKDTIPVHILKDVPQGDHTIQFVIKDVTEVVPVDHYENVVVTGNDTTYSYHEQGPQDTGGTVIDTSQSVLPSNEVNTIFVDSKGLVWVGTNGGLVKYSGGIAVNYNSANSGLFNDTINTIHENLEGMIFIGTQYGVVAFNGVDQWHYLDPEFIHLPARQVTSLLCDASGTVWIGTVNGLGLFNHGIWTTFNTFNSLLPANMITTIAVSGDVVLIGTVNGLAYYKSGQITRETQFTGMHINALLSTPPRRFWVGTQEHGLYLKEGLYWYSYHTGNSGLPENSVVALSFFEGQGLWIGTPHNGLAQFENFTLWSVYTASNSVLPSMQINALGHDIQGNTWAGTNLGAVQLQRE